MSDNQRTGAMPVTVDAKRLSDAAANLEWLAAQPVSAWKAKQATRDDVVIVCETVRGVRVLVERALYDTASEVPARLTVRQAASALTWCNTIGALGVRGPAAVSTLRQLGRREEADELSSSIAMLDEFTSSIRARLGADPTLLTREQARVVEQNLGLVRWAVARWGSNLPECGGVYSREDAYQDAVIGLARAVRLFEPERGFKLATFAYAYLYSAIMQGEGRARGLEYRQARAEGVPSVPATSLDEGRLGSGGGMQFVPRTLHDCIADPASGDGFELAEWAVSSVDLLDARRRVCRDAKDLQVFDAVAGLGDGESVSSAFRSLAGEWGTSSEYVRTRWQAIRPRLSAALEHLRAS